VPHIPTAPDIPGIRSLLQLRPEIIGPITALAQELLHAPNSLSPGERELIAARVSALNDCTFCRRSHEAVAACHLHDEALPATVVQDPEAARISPKLKALLAIADLVQRSGRAVTEEHVHRARAAGATDREIHDTVLIAAAFCMFNRYVDGLAAWTPDDAQGYRDRAERVAREGYVMSPPPATAGRP
jgi:uncharacterized peroxidase-related enzyme